MAFGQRAEIPHAWDAGPLLDLWHSDSCGKISAEALGESVRPLAVSRSKISGGPPFPMASVRAAGGPCGPQHTLCPRDLLGFSGYPPEPVFSLGRD